MDDSIRHLLAKQIAANFSSFGEMIPKRIPQTTVLDFKENYKEIMSDFSMVYTVIESCVPGLDEESMEMSAAISASISHLFGSGNYDINSMGELNNETYNQQVLLPVHSTYKIFYDYVRLIMKASSEHNKRLGLK